MGNFVNYYPGDAYVNSVGLDVYDTAWGRYPGASLEFENIVTQPWGLTWLASFAATHKKSIDLPEVGLGWGYSSPGSGPVSGSGSLCGGDDPTFAVDMLNWAESHQANFVFWDKGTSSIESGSNPQTLEALKTALSAAATTPSSPTTTTTTSTVPTSTPTTLPAPTTNSTVPATTTTLPAPATSTTLPKPLTPTLSSTSAKSASSSTVASSGYYEVAADGGLFAVHAPFHGSVGGIKLNSPIVGMAHDAATGGYYEVAADGGIFAFDAPFHGSVGGLKLNSPIVEIGRAHV